MKYLPFKRFITFLQNPVQRAETYRDESNFAEALLTLAPESHNSSEISTHVIEVTTPSNIVITSTLITSTRKAIRKRMRYRPFRYHVHKRNIRFGSVQNPWWFCLFKNSSSSSKSKSYISILYLVIMFCRMLIEI